MVSLLLAYFDEKEDAIFCYVEDTCLGTGEIHMDQVPLTPTIIVCVLLAPSNRDLQQMLGWFTTECEAAGMRISTSKSESMVLARKKVEYLLRDGEEVLPQVKEFKYLGILFTSEEGFRTCPTGRRPRGWPRTRWRDYISRLAWERLGVPLEELMEVAGERAAWASLLKLLSP
ncbi:hypothetical protein D4764_04G0013990 [Takifugu flavidus]|uniref:Reverse transcriptase domain-containing protein n=1 Tax=Takifugu flavidus TaxID=433684 RepID=A0A5C6N5K2_9TELE|nr:hypothetical protein D4764_04G0013990 [Takifugu flavidus]